MLTVTATELPRLMACNGSRLMGSSTSLVQTDDTVRDEGNAAHWLVEQVHAGHFTVEELIDRKAPNGIYITSEMVGYLEEYLKAIREGGYVEIDTSHGTLSWQINGRADLAKYHAPTKHLRIADLKYGWSIVEPENNWTLISHAIGYIAQHNLEFSTITFTIYQPRAYHPAGRIRSWQIDHEQLKELWKQLATTLTTPNDILNTGKHCYNCPALATCPAARKAQMNAVDASEKAFVDEIDNEELSFQLDHMKRAIDVLKQQEKAYNEEALNRIKQGQIVNNYSLDHELTNRMWQKHVNPDLMKILTGKDLGKKQDLITPAEAERRGVSKEVVAPFVERCNKGVKLIRMDANTKANKLFNQP